jgi:hypothetical protein
VTSGQINDLEDQVKEGFAEVVAELRDQLSWEFRQFELLALESSSLTLGVIPSDVFWRVGYLLLELRCHDMKPIGFHVDAQDRTLTLVFPRSMHSVLMHFSDKGTVAFNGGPQMLHTSNTNKELIEALQAEVKRRRDTEAQLRAGASELSGPEGVGS